MPVSRHPNNRDFFDIGRDKRASDRQRYVGSLMVRKNAAKLAKKSLSVRVMAVLLRRGASIRLSCSRAPMNRAQAIDRERRTIERLVAAGFLLTNFQHNPHRHKNAGTAVRAILSGKRLRDA